MSSIGGGASLGSGDPAGWRRGLDAVGVRFGGGELDVVGVRLDGGGLGAVGVRLGRGGGWVRWVSVLVV